MLSGDPKKRFGHLFPLSLSTFQVYFENAKTVCWFALRVTYCREMIVKKHFDALGIPVFIPMRYEYFKEGRKKVRRLVPAIHNLLFVRTDKATLDSFKQNTSLPIRYVMRREQERSYIVVVPDADMDNFIRVAGTCDDGLFYLGADTVDLRQGQRVRVTQGIFAGAVGTLLRVKGCRDRRVVVSLEGFVHCVAASIPPAFLEKI